MSFTKWWTSARAFRGCHSAYPIMRLLPVTKQPVFASIWWCIFICSFTGLAKNRHSCLILSINSGDVTLSWYTLISQYKITGGLIEDFSCRPIVHPYCYLQIQWNWLQKCCKHCFISSFFVETIPDHGCTDIIMYCFCHFILIVRGNHHFHIVKREFWGNISGTTCDWRYLI